MSTVAWFSFGFSENRQMRSSGFVLLKLALFFFGSISIESRVVGAFVGTYGINYGRIADNIPSPDKVVLLLKQAKIRNVRIYDADHSVLKAFSGSGLELVVGLPNEYLKEMNSNADHAVSWVKDNVQSFLPETRIRGIAIGNEVLGGPDYELWGVLLGAAKNVYNALKKLNLEDTVQITTAHSQAVFSNSYPPSSCVFRENVVQFMKPLLEFFDQIGSPFCLNAYPFLAYTYNTKDIDINYALFQPAKGIYDPKTDLHYDNMLDAQIDAAYMALEDAGFEKMEVIVTETGWASKGDSDEPAATPENARTYNYNLRKRLAKKKGTPLRPKRVLKAYIFALFNEYQKPGKTSERNFGLFKADGTLSYDIGFHGLKSAASRSLLSLYKDVSTLLVSGSALLLLLRQ
ncbi:PREDICTED: glucan endo-1,3-beta-glucosidase 11 [Tarenaya hassleriana]|uniref:glucan endo-1,3-beta-glucosidase 11 n=1 Tax=Tarenaya hassleriana TaxID=28532 RepID=UPI00053C5400|nr:PREDICTED: glucan endo-1,3-beta-glucosidase 11 [Tarenaya hassleriana]